MFCEKLQKLRHVHIENSLLLNFQLYFALEKKFKALFKNYNKVQI